MKHNGFVLIEFLIALFIGSALSISMMGSLTMMHKNNALVDGFIDIYGSVARLQQQLERDLSGLVVPTSFFQTATAMSVTSTAQSATAQSATQPASAAQKNRYAFFATKKENMTDLLTFITTNPLSSYWSDKVGQAKSRLVRVVYRLEPDKENAKLFRLMRQEGMDLDFTAYAPNAAKSIRALEIAHGIKKYAMQFMYEEDKTINNAVGGQKASTACKVLDEWRFEEQKDGAKNRSDKLTMPQFVRLILVIVDERQAREETFEYTYPILCDVDVEAPKRPQQPVQTRIPCLPPIKKGGIRAKLASIKPTTMPGGLLGQFSQAMKGHA